MRIKTMLAALGAACVACVEAATFTGELYWGYWDSYDECDIWEENADSIYWRDGFVNVDGNREPASWSVDQFVFPVRIEPGETFNAEILHITSTPEHIKSVTIYSDQEMFNLYKEGDDDGYYLRKFWPGNALNTTRAWIVVSLNTVTTGDAYIFDFAKSPVINDPDHPKYYNPADGDGEPSSKWTVTSYAKQFGVSLTGTRKVTKSVSFDVKISETGETFGRRLWNVYCPFEGKDWDKIDKVDDKGGDEAIIVAPGLYYVSDEMIQNQASSQSSGVVPEEWKKARVLNGVATMALPNPVVGLFSVKCGKANAKKGTAKVSATYTPISGKKKTYKAQLVDVTSGAVTVAWDDLTVTIDGDTFSGSDSLAGGIGVGSANVGGDWTRTDATVQVELTDGALPEGTFEDLLPDGEPVVPKAGKWAFAKATAVKWAKPKNGTDLPEIYDETTGKGLIIDDSKGKTNLSAMKLTYTPKTGIFKGSFKVYALQNGRLRKFTAKANGVVVEGTGYGIATIPNGPTFFVSVK